LSYAREEYLPVGVATLQVLMAHEALDEYGLISVSAALLWHQVDFEFELLESEFSNEFLRSCTKGKESATGSILITLV
jgi:hypothetical protein